MPDEVVQSAPQSNVDAPSAPANSPVDASQVPTAKYTDADL